MKRAGFWRRVFAYIIDSLVIGIVFSVVGVPKSLQEEVSQKTIQTVQEAVPEFTNASFEGMTNEEKARELVSNIVLSENGERISSFMETTQQAIYRYVAFSSIFIVVYFLAEALFGKALGKLALNMTIVSADGSPATKGQLFIRYIIKVSSSICYFISFFAGYWLYKAGNVIGLIVVVGFFMVLGSNKQALHDKIAGTVVKINE